MHLHLFQALVVCLLFTSALAADKDEENKKEVQARVRPLLEKHNQKMKLELEELAKKQKGDSEFQKLLKEIKESRDKHKGEEKEGGPKSMAELNADVLGDMYQLDMKLNEEQAKAILGSDTSPKTSPIEVRRRKRGGALNTAYFTTSLWPNAIAPYIFAPDVCMF